MSTMATAAKSRRAPPVVTGEQRMLINGVSWKDYVILRERDIHAVASDRIDGGTGLYL